MIYSQTLDDFNLKSLWKCKGVEKDGVWRWYILEGPTEDAKTLEFVITLPLDAVVARAWISVDMGSPMTGAALMKVNDLPFKDGVAELTGINAEMQSYTAVFRFQANGAIYQDTNQHSASMAIRAPTINVEYTSESEDAPEIDENAPGNINRKVFDGGRLPRWLDGDLREKGRLEPDRVSLELNLYPLSTATMDIHDGSQRVAVRDFFELFSPDGSEGIFRAVEVNDNYGANGGQTVYLEHALTTLKDDLTIRTQSMTGTFRQVGSSLLESQSVPRWVIGDVDLPDEYEVIYTRKVETILAALTGVLEHMPEGYALDLDTWQVPWRINLRYYGTDAFCEGRMHRNLQNVSITFDSSDLCTRLYPYGAGEGEDRINLSTLTGALFEDADTIDKWGIVAKTITDDNIYDSITLQTVARQYLERHKEPTVSITLDAFALFAATGIPLDRFRRGYVCRLAMPDCGVVMHERVIAVSYPDVYNDPKTAVVTLANRLRNASDEIAELTREAAGMKLLGGSVATEEIKSSAGDITYDDPKVTRFNINTYGNLLSAKVRYTTQPSTTCRLRVDGTTISGAPDMAQPIDIMRYLKTDANGIPTVGEHYVEFSPVASSSSVTHWIHTTIILKTIEKQ